MQCKKCGNNVTEHTKFCNACGTKLEWESEQQPPVQTQQVSANAPYGSCHVCGKALKQNAIFCVGCGTAVPSAQPETAMYVPTADPMSVPAPKAEKKKGYGPVILITVLVTLLVIAGATAAYLYFTGAFSPEESKADEPKTEETAEESTESSDATDEADATDKKKTSDEQDEDKPSVKKASTYSVCAADVTWTEAAAEAKRLKAQLVSINDEEEFEKVCALAEENELVVFWVGATRDSEENWMLAKWQDGTRMRYTAWLTSEPSYETPEGEEELYLMVFKVNDVWYFNDAQNDVSQYYAGKMGYILEIEE